MQTRRKGHVDHRVIAELLDGLWRHLYSRGFAGGLNPAQWAALRYFAQVDGNARSVTSFARARGSTQGTATQTVAALVRKGYLRRMRVANDLRRVRLDVTPAGQRRLRADPLKEVIAALGAMQPGARRGLLVGLASLRSLLSSKGRHGIGE